MGTVPSTKVVVNLKVHIDALIREVIAATKTGDGKHMTAAADQLRQFIEANFKPITEE